MIPTRSSDLDLMRLREQYPLDSSPATQRPTSFLFPSGVEEMPVDLNLSSIITRTPPPSAMLPSVFLANSSRNRTATREFAQRNPNLFTGAALHVGVEADSRALNFGSALRITPKSTSSKRTQKGLFSSKFHEPLNIWKFQFNQTTTTPSSLEPSATTNDAVQIGVDTANQNTFSEALDHFRSVWDRAKTQLSLFNNYEVTGKEEWTTAWNAAKSACDTKKLAHRQDIIKIARDATNAAKDAAKWTVGTKRTEWTERAKWDAEWAERATERAEWAESDALTAESAEWAERVTERAAWTAENTWNAAENAWNTTWNAIITKKHCEESVSHSGLGLIQTTKPQPALDTKPLQDLTKKRKHPADQKTNQPLKRTRYSLRSREIIVQTRPSSLASLDDELETHFPKPDTADLAHTPRVHGASISITNTFVNLQQCWSDPKIFLATFPNNPRIMNLAPSFLKNNPMLQTAARSKESADIAAYYDLAAKDFEQNKMYDQLLICREELVNLKIEMHGENHLLTAQVV